MLNTLETQQRMLSDAVSVINQKLDLLYSGGTGTSASFPSLPPPPPPPGGFPGQPSVPGPTGAPPSGPYSSATGHYTTSDSFSGTELYVRPPDPDMDGSHGTRPLSRDRPGSDHSDPHGSLSFIPEEREEGGGNASETDSVIHGHCSDPDDSCGVSIDEDEIIPQKASIEQSGRPVRKRSKKRHSSSSSLGEPTSPVLLRTTVQTHTMPSYGDTQTHLSSSGLGSSGEFKPKYIANTEELNKLVRLLEPHS